MIAGGTVGTGLQLDARTASSIMPMRCLTTWLSFNSEPGTERSSVSQAATSDAILLATDGSAGSADAVIMAMALARWHALPLQILTVVEPLPVWLDDDLASLHIVEFAQAREDEAHHRVRHQIHYLFGRDDPLGINIEFGTAARSIERLAGEWDAKLVVLGLGVRERGGRSGAGRTALHVATGAPVATLVVDAGRWRIPRRIVVGVDFSDASFSAARLAVAIAACDATVHLVHVRAVAGFPPVGADAWTGFDEQGALSRLETLSAQLQKDRPDIRVHASLACGAVEDALRQAAVATDADVVAVGRHGHNWFDRLWLGSAAQALLRDTPCSLLVTPPTRSARVGS